MHIPANLLSLGALDFGVIVEGAIVLIENIVRHLSHTDGVKTSTERISFASHEVQRPVFYAIVITITAFLPIFTLQRVEGRLFHPMAWTVAFALLGALLFSILVAPVLASFAFAKGAKEWHNPVMTFVSERYNVALRWAIRRRMITVGVCLLLVAFANYLAFSGVIGSEFLPTWMKAHSGFAARLRPALAQMKASGLRTRRESYFVPSRGSAMHKSGGAARRRTDNTGFFNTEYFVDLKPKEQWRLSSTKIKKN